jgi:hypothetical protein
MPVTEIELITEKTRCVIGAAKDTIAYSETIIEQSKRLIRGIDKTHREREALKVNRYSPCPKAKNWI